VGTQYPRIDSDPGRHSRGQPTPPGVHFSEEFRAPQRTQVIKYATIPGLMEETGRVKVWNPKLKKTMQTSQEKSDKALAKSTSAPSLASASAMMKGSASQLGMPKKSMVQSRSQADIREELKRRADLANICETREADMTNIRERIDRNKDLREERFNRLLEEVMSEDAHKKYCAEVLRNHEKDIYRRESAMCDAWHANVFDTLQRQIATEMNPPNRELQQQQRGNKTVGIRHEDRGSTARELVEAGDRLVATYVQDADPMKADIRKFAKEESFRRNADRVLYGDPDVTSHDVLRPGRIRKFTSKPTLEPVWWDQLRLQSTPYGHFAQVCEAGQGFRTMVKRDGHIPPEHDGVAAAGKRRTRWEKNDVGVLKGDIRHQGEGVLSKTDYGASNAAPNQDHYLFETGKRIVDTEFPQGKRMWLEPPGAVPRSIIEHL
jgi:hypothetical protein